MRLFLTLCVSLISAATSCLAAGETELTIVSYNIRSGKGMNNEKNLAGTIATLRKQDADVLILQEVDMKTRRSGRLAQAEEIAKALAMNFYFAPTMDFDDGQYGNAILSKFALENTKTIELTGGGEKRSAGFAEIVKNDKRVAIVDVHMDLNESLHPKHIRTTAEAIKKQLSSPAVPVIWGGDFNAEATSPIWAILKKNWELPEKQGSQKATYPAANPKIEIDWFLFTPKTAMTVLKYEVIDEPAASDHRPVLLKVKL